jgi:uncharacterized protein
MIMATRRAKLSFAPTRRTSRNSMDPLILSLIALGVLIVALLYSSVGHAGASGYLAVMALAGLAPAEIRPAALMLNILVASIASLQFWRAGHFRWNLFWPFAVLAVPAAWVGGRLTLPVEVFGIMVGLILLFSAARFFWKPGDPVDVKMPGLGLSLGAGAGLGLLSGLTGTGGGIFLTPLMLLCRWGRTKNVAAVSALFILVNSAAGLLGFVSTGRAIPAFTWWLAVAAVGGGTLGSYLGSRRFPVRTIQILLAVVLVIAGAKLVLGR